MSAIAKGNGHKSGPVGALQPHQNVMLGFRLRLGQRFADVRDVRHCFAADVEYDITGLDALIAGRAVGFDPCHDDTLVAGARYIAGASISPR